MSDLIQPTPTGRYQHHFTVYGVETENGVKFYIDESSSSEPVWDPETNEWYSANDAYTGSLAADRRIYDALNATLRGEA